ncbi:MAG: SAM-dependent methyltransferase [Rhizobiales bacterium PAR1]|nr:MAG: SAM-dependent methyltransferase [Rhizobiales bacterium PAR1]
MTQQVPELFDFVKAQAADHRALRLGAERFLLDRVSDDLVDRLAPVLREFEVALDFGTPFGAFGKALCTARKIETLESQSNTPGSRALQLPDTGLPPEHYGLILSGMLMHRINDLPGLLIQLRRALKPDGLMMAAFPGGDTLSELRDVLIRAESEITGAAGLRVFPMIDVRAAGQLLQRSGFALPVADSEKLMVRYSDLFALIRDLRAMGATAAPLVRPGQPGLTRAILLRAAELYAMHYADADGRIRATFEVIWISGWAPHASQQKPLKPGSAKMRLDDALRQIEQGKKS